MTVIDKRIDDAAGEALGRQCVQSNRVIAFIREASGCR